MNEIEELMEHRNRLFLALVKVYDNYLTPLGSDIHCWKVKMSNGHFMLGMTVEKSQFQADVPREKFLISYRMPMIYWHLAQVIELQKAPQSDDYTSRDVLERLFRL